MKIKEVCMQTGLTKRTVRFYEEKGLISPRGEWKNGRIYREYDQKDVERLLEIATLRKALFTIEEIQCMQQDPAQISAVFCAYGARIQAMEQMVRKLSRKVLQLDPEAIDSVSKLASEIAIAVDEMPLPKTDRMPRFRHLDETEELPPHVQWQTNLDEMVPDRRVFTQMTASALGYKSLNQLNQLQATQASLEGSRDGVVKTQHRDSTPLRLFKGICSAVMVLALLVFLFQASRGQFYWSLVMQSDITIRALWTFLGTLLLRLAISGVQIWIKQRQWLRGCRK